MKTLRMRLLASYVAILLITLILIGVTLVFFLRARPLPTDDIVSELTATLLDVRLVEAVRINISGSEMRFSVGSVQTQVIAYVDEQAEARGLRALVIDSDELAVVFDSDGAFAQGDALNETERQPLLLRGAPRVSLAVYKGRFEDPDGSEWIYVAQPLFFQRLNQNQAGDWLMLAAPVPHPSLTQVFQTFGDELFTPLLQAGLVALLISLVLVVLISRSVARPLQEMSTAAQHLARGDFSQRVSEDGPREVAMVAVSFNEMAVRVSDIQQAQRDFLANVSHDLRTPLTSIQGFSQAIVDGVASDPESAQRAAQVIHSEAARLHRMVEDLLDMARLEAGRLDLLRQAVEIGPLLQAVGDSLSVKASERELALELAIPKNLPRIAGDGDRLAQVFTNLLDNAIKHTSPGGQVGLSAERDDTGLLVTVRDTGEGIPPDDLSRIFERFYQVDKARKHGSGTGLGLAITRQIVEAHGGTIRVASQVGQGSVFSVWLPLPTPDMSTIARRL